MKRAKKLWIMAGILGLALVLTLSVALMDHKAEKIRASGEPILSVPVDSVTALSWDNGGETLSFRKEDGWIYEGDPDFPVSQQILEQMLSTFETFSAAFAIQDVEDYGQYGLQDPVCTIKFTAGDQNYRVALGSFSKMDQQRYVDIGDGNAYLVFNDPMVEFDRDLRHVIQNDTTTYLQDANRITFTGAETYSIWKDPEAGISHREDDIYYAEKNGQLLPLDPINVQNYLADLTLMELTDYQTYTADKEDLSQFGLDKPELSVEVHYDELLRGEPTGEEKTMVIHVGRNPEQVKAAEDAKDDNADPVPAYVRVGDSQIIYRIQPGEYDKVMACSYDDLRHPEIFPASTEDILSLEVTLDGSVYQLSAKDPKAEPLQFFYGDSQVDVSPVLSAIHSLRAQDFTQEPAAGKLELRLRAELKNSKSVTVELYRIDGQQCLAQVDGTPVARIPRSQVVDLQEDLNAILLSPSQETQAENP